MDTSIIAALIGILGTGTVGLLIFIFTGLRTAILDNSTRIGGLEKGFAGLEERFGGLEKGFSGLEERFGGLERRFGGLEKGFSGLEERFGGLEKGFGGLEERTISEFGQIKDVLTRIEATQAEQGRQIEKLSGGDLP